MSPNSLSRRQTGLSLIAVIVSSAIIAVAFLAFAKGVAFQRRFSTQSKSDVYASTYAAELIEYFRSHTNEQLKEYLEINPIDGLATGGLGAYPLCAHVNILDRTTNTVKNNDPLADLPTFIANSFDDNSAINRWYQIQVIDLETLAIRKDICASTARQIYLFGKAPQPGETVAIGEKERFLVTVGVSWIPKNSPQPKRIVLSAVVP